MADAMCGPSNAAKGLVAHANRDRSLHQDRLVGPPQPGGSATFRTQPHGSVGADGAFEAFQHGHDMPAHLAPAMAGLTMEHGGSRGAHAVPSGFRTAAFPAPGAPNLDTGAFDAGAFHEFVGSLDNRPPQLPTGQPPRAARIPGVRGPGGVTNSPITAPATGMSYAATFDQPSEVPSGFRGFSPGISPYVSRGMAPAAADIQFHGVSAGLVGAHSEASGAGPAAGVGQLFDEEAFNAAFGEYDEDEFDRELDAWASEHGNRQSSRAAEPPTSEEMVEIDANLEALAEELEARRAAGDPAVLPQKGPEAEARRARQEQEDLARAATEILASVSDNPSEKFQRSTFLDLMRRIQTMEVVVSDNDLVDSRTGDAVTSTAQSNPETTGQ